ncbi:MAG: GH3 family domain-containing protein [Bacteroidota bacterium]
MAVLGEIIKKTIEIADQILDSPDPVKSQEKELRELLSKAEDTAFGKYYEFSKIKNSDDVRNAFAEVVPYHSYDQMRERWWQRVIDGAKDITWPGKVNYFAVSSGTTSTRKLIPVTADMLLSIRRAGMQQLKGVADFDLPAEFFEKEILMFGSSTNLKKVNDHYEGEISGISASQLPFWFEGYYRPGKEIASIDNWDERVDALAREAHKWDIGTISGIPSWIELMLKNVIKYHKLNNIHELWPNFTVFTSGGVAFDPYKKSFQKICAKPIVVIDTYLASEGYLATQIRKDTDAMALITNNGIYFEFVPFLPENIDEDGSIRQGAQALKIEEVEEGVDYVLVISTSAGAWRYMIGDTVMFTNKARAEIKITGRTKHFLNVVGSQLSVIQMNRAMEVLNQQEKVDIKEFTVAAVLEDEEYKHQWYLGVSDTDTGISDEILAEKLDAYLKENNKNYKVARSKALKRVEVKTIPVGIFQKWAEETNQKGGQVKVPRVMKQEDFMDWEKYVRQKL